MTSIEGFEHYIIFEDGMIINFWTGKEMKTSKNKKGYIQLVLCKNGKSKNFYGLYKHYSLSANAMNSAEGITKTYLSIAKHYEENNTENRKPVKQTRQFHI